MIKSTPAIALLVILTAGNAGATEINDLGSLDFPNSGAEQAQEAFARGVLLLHSFEYEDAREAFQEASAIDPDFALAFWGEAMTHNHPLWRQQDREAALEALSRYASSAAERAAKAPTAREAAYLAALEVLYGEGDKVSRDEAYSEAMRTLSESFPDDLEAQAFYALSILGTTQGRRDFRVYMRAGAVAEEVFAANPRHPGAAHYLIHSYDDPVHAPLGLRAARVYNQIAPAASHAQHMISHIFVALGQWADSVESNIRAYEVSKERQERKGLPLDQLNYHAMQWLEYSYLQLGQLDKARQVLDLMAGYAAQSSSERAVWYYAVMRAMWNVETDGLDAPPSIDMEVLELAGLVHDLFSDGYVAATRDDLQSARKILVRMQEARREAEEQAVDPATGGYAANFKDTLEVAIVLEKSLEGLILLGDGEFDAAIAMFEEATAIEAARPLQYGPPNIVLPSHEIYGWALVMLDRPDEARVQFETALSRAPRRTNSLMGLLAAAKSIGDEDTLATACSELSSILAGSDQLERIRSSCAGVDRSVAP